MRREGRVNTRGAMGVAGAALTADQKAPTRRD